MKLTIQNIQQIQGYLRNVAEVDPDDVIANGASQLAVDLEYVNAPFEFDSLNAAEQAMVHYAIRKREKYVLTPGAKHAIVVG